MAWTDPRTWVTSEVVTATIMNTHVRDNLRAIPHDAGTGYSGSDTDIANTTTETTIVSQSIGASTLGVRGICRAEMWGDALYNNSTGDTFTLRVKFDGTTYLEDAIAGAALSANRFSWRFNVWLINRDVANAQLIIGELSVQSGGTTATANIGVGGWTFSGNLDSTSIIKNTAAVDTTLAKTLLVTGQWSAASANNSWRKQARRIEVQQAA